MSKCECKNCKDKAHQSDCAVHNEPAYPNGVCDCAASPTDDGQELMAAYLAGVYSERDKHKSSELQLPEGWKLVPIEPTVEMKIEGDNAGFWCGDKYSAMIAAAPPNNHNREGA